MSLPSTSILLKMPRPYAELSQDEEKLLHNNDLSESSSSLGLHDSRRSSLMGKIRQHSYVLHWLAHSVTIVLLLVLLGEQRRDSPRRQELYCKNHSNIHPLMLKLFPAPAYGRAPPPLHYEYVPFNGSQHALLIPFKSFQDCVLAEDALQRYCLSLCM